MRLNAFAGCAQRKFFECLNSLGVREAVSGSGRATMRFNAFAGCAQGETKIKLELAWCSRGCFSKRPGDYETYCLHEVVILVVVLAVVIVVVIVVVVVVVLVVVLVAVPAVVRAVVLVVVVVAVLADVRAAASFIS